MLLKEKCHVWYGQAFPFAVDDEPRETFLEDILRMINDKCILSACL